MEPDRMEPDNDPRLTELLRTWQVPGAPSSLDGRVLGRRRRWWSVLLTGSIRIPVPVALTAAVILLAMAAALARRAPAPQPPAPASLADFQPVKELHVRVIRSHYEDQ